jgi:stage III sporulation protein AE
MDEYTRAIGAGDILPNLSEGARAATEGLDPGVLPDLQRAADNLLGEAAEKAGGIFRDSLGGMLLILGVVALCGVAAALLEEDKRLKFVPLAAVLGIAAVTGGTAQSLLALGRGAVREIGDFTKLLLPTVAAAAAASGAPGEAFAKQGATLLFSGLLLDLSDRVLQPMVYAYFALCTCGALVGQELLGRMAKFVKWAFTALLTALLTLYVFYLGVSGVISGSADAMAQKTARLALSGGVPVVGGVLGDAAETVLAGASIVRNALGLFGLFALAGICLTPFLRLGIQTLLFRLTAALAAPLADKTVVRYLDDVGTVFSLTLALVGSAAFVLMVSLVSGIKAVTPW